MSFKVNEKNPARKLMLRERRLAQLSLKGTNPDVFFSDHKYVPGNGPSHRLGKKQ